MRRLAAVTVAVCCLAAPAWAEQGSSATAAAPENDPIGLLLDDPIGFLLEDPIALLLERPFDAATLLAAPRARSVFDFDFDAQAVDVMGVDAGTPLTAPAPRRTRNAPVSSLELAARGFEGEYARSWASIPVHQNSPDVEAPRFVSDGNLSLRVQSGL